jgi:hypothetical protein
MLPITLLKVFFNFIYILSDFGWSLKVHHPSILKQRSVRWNWNGALGLES